MKKIFLFFLIFSVFNFISSAQAINPSSSPLDIYFCLDVSGSQKIEALNRNDSYNITYTRAVFNCLLSFMKKHDRMSVVIFADKPFMLRDLMLQYEFDIKEFVNSDVNMSFKEQFFHLINNRCKNLDINAEFKALCDDLNTDLSDFIELSSFLGRKMMNKYSTDPSGRLKKDELRRLMNFRPLIIIISDGFHERMQNGKKWTVKTKKERSYAKIAIHDLLQCKYQYMEYYNIPLMPIFRIISNTFTETTNYIDNDRARTSYKFWKEVFAEYNAAKGFDIDGRHIESSPPDELVREILKKARVPKKISFSPKKRKFYSTSYEESLVVPLKIDVDYFFLDEFTPFNHVKITTSRDSNPLNPIPDDINLGKRVLTNKTSFSYSLSLRLFSNVSNESSNYEFSIEQQKLSPCFYNLDFSECKMLNISFNPKVKFCVEESLERINFSHPEEKFIIFFKNYTEDVQKLEVYRQDSESKDGSFRFNVKQFPSQGSEEEFANEKEKIRESNEEYEIYLLPTKKSQPVEITLIVPNYKKAGNHFTPIEFRNLGHKNLEILNTNFQVKSTLNRKSGVTFHICSIGDNRKYLYIQRSLKRGEKTVDFLDNGSFC